MQLPADFILVSGFTIILTGFFATTIFKKNKRAFDSITRTIFIRLRNNLVKNASFIVFFSSLFGFAQNSNLTSNDSLIRLIETTKGREKLETILRFCEVNNRSAAHETLKYSTDGIVLADELEDVNAKAKLLRFKGVCAFTLGNMESSLRILQKAIDISRSINDSVSLGKSHRSLGVYYFILGDFKTSRVQDSLSLAIAEKVGNLEMIYEAKKDIASSYLGQKMHSKALELYDELFSFCNTHQLDCTGAIVNRAIAINNVGKPSEALAYFFEARKAFIAKEDFDTVALIEHHIGFLLQRAELYEEALNYYISIKEFYEKSGNVNRLSAIYLNIGEVMLELDKLEEAEDYLQKALDIKIEKGITSIGDPLIDLGLVTLKRKNYKLAFDYFQEAQKVYEAAEDDSSIAAVYNGYSMSYLGLQDYKNAERFAVRSLALNKKFNLKLEMAESYENLVQAYEGQNKFDLALQAKKELEILNVDLKGSKEVHAIAKKLVTETLKENENKTIAGSGSVNTINESSSSDKKWVWIFSALFLIFVGSVFYFLWRFKNPSKTISTKAEFLEGDEASLLLEKLQHTIRVHQPFLNENLTLKELATLIGTTDKKLSILLNHHLKMNFYDYINAHRIKAFKKKLDEEKDKRYSIIGLAFECGFNSKSSFYRAFKKETGISPAEYKKNKVA